MTEIDTERARLLERKNNKGWKKWGPYLTERQWGTVREDYSANGDAWNSITHDMARSKAYRWGEEGIGGISDNKQHICFALAFWSYRKRIQPRRRRQRNLLLPRRYAYAFLPKNAVQVSTGGFSI